MKNKMLILFVLLLCLAPNAPAAEPQIVVVSLSEVRVDGQNWGQLADVIVNNSQLASAVQIAALKWEETLREAFVAERRALNAEREAMSAEKVVIERQRDEAQAKAAALLSAVDVIEVSGTALPNETKEAIRAARQSREEKLRTDNVIRKAALDAELAAELAKLPPAN